MATKNVTITKVRCLCCQEDGVDASFHFLHDHLNQVHGTNISSYLEKFGEDTPIMTDAVWVGFQAQARSAKITRAGTSKFADIVKVGRIKLKRQSGDMDYTFPRPSHYMYPKKGDAASRVERVARAFKYRRNTFIYGPAGSGKSAIVRALCHDLNLESSHYPMREGLDTELYIGQMAVVVDEKSGLNVTRFEKGKLLQDLEGRVGDDGIRRGVVILLDDVDRAPAAYHEVLRHCLEDNAKNIFVPELGVNIHLHPDTMIVATANSAGRGDTTGYYSSVEEMDESILDRFQRVVEFTFMEEEQELTILKRKFPRVLEKGGEDAFAKVMQVSGIMRSLVSTRAIFASFSHRRLVQWLMSLDELIQENDDQYEFSMLRESAQDWCEWLDTTARDVVIDRAFDVVLGKR